MPEEPETTAPETAIQRIENAAEEAIAAVKGAPVDVTAIHAEIDVLMANVTRNISALIPTSAHNFIASEAESLKARIAKLL